MIFVNGSANLTGIIVNFDSNAGHVFLGLTLFCLLMMIPLSWLSNRVSRPFGAVCFILACLSSVIAHFLYSAIHNHFYHIADAGVIVLFGIVFTTWGSYEYFTDTEDNGLCRPLGHYYQGFSVFVFIITIFISCCELLTIAGCFRYNHHDTREGHMKAAVIITGVIQKIIQASLYTFYLQYKLPAIGKQSKASFYLKICSLYNFFMWLESIMTGQEEGKQFLEMFFPNSDGLITGVYTALLIEYRFTSCLLFWEHAVYIQSYASLTFEKENSFGKLMKSFFKFFNVVVLSVVIVPVTFIFLSLPFMVYVTKKVCLSIKSIKLRQCATILVILVIGTFILAIQLLDCLQYKVKSIGPKANIIGCVTELLVILLASLLIKETWKKENIESENNHQSHHEANNPNQIEMFEVDEGLDLQQGPTVAQDDQLFNSRRRNEDNVGKSEITNASVLYNNWPCNYEASSKMLHSKFRNICNAIMCHQNSTENYQGEQYSTLKKQQPGEHETHLITILVMFMGVLAALFWILKIVALWTWVQRYNELQNQGKPYHERYLLLAIKFLIRSIALSFQIALYLLIPYHAKLTKSNIFGRKFPMYYLFLLLTFLLLASFINSVGDEYEGNGEKRAGQAHMRIVLVVLYHIGLPIHLAFIIHLTIHFGLISRHLYAESQLLEQCSFRLENEITHGESEDNLVGVTDEDPLILDI